MSKLAVSAELQYTKVPTNEETKDSKGTGEKEKEKSEIRALYGYGVRHIQLLLFFFYVVMSFIARGHLGVTLVAMTTRTESNSDEEITLNLDNITNINGSKSVNNYDEDYENYDLNETGREIFENLTSLNVTEVPRTIYSTFDWPKPVQEMVLTAFFMGYCLMMIPVSLVCQRWGGKVALQASLLVNGVVSILTPSLAYWGGWKAVFVCRLLQGLSQAGTYPGLQTLLAQWVPDCEKSTLTSYVYTGATTGSVIGFQIGGLISDVAGWPAAFWTIGSMCLVMFVLLTVLGAASPRVHKTISEEERNFIIGHTEVAVVKVQISRAPWKALLTSKPLLANYSTAVGSSLAFIFFFTQVPSYIHYIYGIDVKNSGMLSSLPYIVSIFASIAYGVISDYLINHNILSKKNTRRYSNLLSQIGMASALVGASYANNTTIAVIWFVVFMVSHMGIHTGWMINQIDLAPNYSGTMIAISNCISNLVVMIMPVVISNVIVDVGNVFQWRIMLYLEAAFCLIPGIIFAIFISAEVQPWNDGSYAEGEIKDVKLESIEKNDAEKNKSTK